ncbi:MAG: TetR/AcrR family transcriptional regulator [Nocardioides sp.]|nr:TetR/AcrR family transcriptional regulator [Nocardioides sp.]
MSSHVYEAPRQGLNARQAETVDKLLRAGLEELRAVGHEALTVRSVAQRAGTAPATAYTYLASKNHLYAELFWRHMSQMPAVDAGDGTATERIQKVTHALVTWMDHEPALTTAVTPALLSSDADVARLRLRIGAYLFERFEKGLGAGHADPALLEAVVLAFSGALLQAGMGMTSYQQMADRLDPVIAVIMRGNE